MYDATPPLEPRSGDYDAMLDRAARRRRTRRVRALAVATPVVALAVAFATLPAPDDAASLRPANAEATESPEPSGEPSSEPTPTAEPGTEPTPSGEPEPTAEPTGDPTTEPEPSGDPEPGADPEPSGSPYPTQTVPPKTRSPQLVLPDTARYDYVPGYAPADCRTERFATAAPDSVNWCADYVGDTELAHDSRVVTAFRLCRSAAADAGTITRYENGQNWMKVRAVDADGEVPWTFSKTPDPKPPAITVQPGDCVEWAVSWTVRMAPGAYRLNPVFVVREYMPADGVWFDVTVTG